jgi:hypothetical protein
LILICTALHYQVRKQWNRREWLKPNISLTIGCNEAKTLNQKLKVHIYKSEDVMKGQIISQEFNKIVWVNDEKGSQYACYIDGERDIKSKEDLSQKEQQSCMNLNSVLGDSW